MKAERLTYPVMTPSAARGVLNAIFWKPEFLWHVLEIWVLTPIRHTLLECSEAGIHPTEPLEPTPCDAPPTDFEPTRRHMLALRDVAYIIKAHIRVLPGAEKNEYAYRDQFRRRVKRGQCYRHPYLGYSQFSAQFCLPNGTEQPIDLSDDLGCMLFDMRYNTQGKPVEPIFFHAYLQKGILKVPQALYDRLYQEVPQRSPRTLHTNSSGQT